MAATHARASRRTWPIVYGRRTSPKTGAGTTLAWVLFLALGLPFLLMTILTVLARGGIVVPLLSPLWQPWPPDLVKPFLGLGVFVATLGFLAFRTGHRRGFSAGVGVGMSAIRTSEEARAASVPEVTVTATETPPLPPPPPEEPPTASP